MAALKSFTHYYIQIWTPTYTHKQWHYVQKSEDRATLSHRSARQFPSLNDALDVAREIQLARGPKFRIRVERLTTTKPAVVNVDDFRDTNSQNVNWGAYHHARRVRDISRNEKERQYVYIDPTHGVVAKFAIEDSTVTPVIPPPDIPVVVKEYLVRYWTDDTNPDNFELTKVKAVNPPEPDVIFPINGIPYQVIDCVDNVIITRPCKWWHR